jgi:hypothetical protein
MTDRNQFEAMLEALINEDQEAAKEIFHNIVVAKSREIYEELLESDFSEGITDADTKPAYGDEEEESTDEPASDDADDSEDDSEEGDVDGDAGDDFVSDVDGDDDGAEPEGDIEDRVMDLEDALEELKAEFEQLMAGEEHEEETGVAGDHGGAMDQIPGFDGADEGPEMGADESQGDVMHHVHHVMEYVNKVPAPKHGDNGVNNKSAVAGPNRMGGSSANIAQNFSTTSGGATNGLLKGSTTLQNAGNINVPGGNAGKTGFKKQEPGHGAEKKGAKPGQNVGAETGANSRDAEKNTKAIIGTKVR